MPDRSHHSYSSVDTLSHCSDYVTLIRGRAEHTPTQLAYAYLERGTELGRALDYRSFDSEVRRLAARLQAHDAAGQRVLLLLPSTLDYVIAYFACLYAGAIAVTLDGSATAKHLARLRSIAADAQPALILAHASTRAALGPQAAQLGHAMWLDVDAPPSHSADDWRWPGVRGDSLAMLQYTSGSIGEPKGVMISHANLLFQGAYLERLLGFGPQDVTVTWLPHFHDMGLILGLLQAAYTGFPCYLMTPTSFIKQPMAWLRALSRLGGTFSPAPNFAYDLCVAQYQPERDADLDLSRWQVALNGAEPVRKSTLERFAATFAPHGFRREALTVGYGMAEATLAISTTARAQVPRSVAARQNALVCGRVQTAGKDESSCDLVSCGRVERGSEAVIVSATLEPLPANEIGEILVGGGSRALGYWRRPEQTRETFEVYLADGRGPYLRTGDLGFIDDVGELYVSGRAKDVLIIHGQNHWPQDLELSAERSHAAVRPHFVAAFSVEIAGREQAVLVAELIDDRLDAYAREQIAACMRTAVAAAHDLRVADIVFVAHGQLPKTTSGKLQRQRCKAAYQAGAWTRQEAC